MIYQIDMGDWSHDGHEHSTAFFVQTEATCDEIAVAYRAGCTKAGVALDHRTADARKLLAVCVDYGQTRISKEAFSFLLGAGWTPDPDFDPDWVNAGDVFDMFLALVRYGGLGKDVSIWKPDDTFFQSGLNLGQPNERCFQMAYGTYGTD